jgi:chromosome segregation ATPase
MEPYIESEADEFGNRLADADSERLDALQNRLELLERERSARVRLLEDERERVTRQAAEAEAKLEAAVRELDVRATHALETRRRESVLENALSASTRTINLLRAELERVHAETDAAAARAAERVAALERAGAEVERARAAVEAQLRDLLKERETLAVYADRAAASRAWRLGHRLTSIARLLSFRPTRGTSALTKIQDRLGAPLALPAPPSDLREPSDGDHPQPGGI